MNNDYLNKPLYPNSDYPNENNNSQKNSSLFDNLSSLLSQGGQSPLLSLLLGMKSGKEGLSGILGKSMDSNPLFQVFSLVNNGVKKESNRSPKSLIEDEVLF